MKYAHSDILDGGLTALKTAATRMLLDWINCLSMRRGLCFDGAHLWRFERG